MGVESYGVEFSGDESIHATKREHVGGYVDGALLALKNNLLGSIEVGLEIGPDTVGTYGFVSYAGSSEVFSLVEAEYVEG